MPVPVLTTVSSGGTITASNHNEVTNYLQPPAGTTTTGNYNQTFFSTAGGQFTGAWLNHAQRNSTPVGSTINETTTPSNFNGGVIAHQDATGYIIYHQSTGVNANANAIGTWALQY